MGRIYFIAPFPPPVTGASTMAEALEQALKRNRSSTVDRLDISMVKLGGSTSQYVLKSIRLLKAAYRTLQKRYDYLVIIPPGGMMLAAYFPVIMAARIRGTNILFDHHNYSYINDVKWIMAWTARLMGKKGVHLFLSKKMGQEFSSLYYTRRWVAASNWGRLNFATATTNRNDVSPLAIGFLSNVTLVKGIDTFLHLVEEVTKRGARVRALVAGGMDPQALELVENAMKRGVEVEALGPIYGSAKAEFLASCDVLALPSRYRNEAEPLVLIEGQLAGCLVIATDIGTISQTVCAGNGHTWSEASFPSEAADLVERLARRPQDLRKVRRAISINAAERANKERQAWNELTAGLV